MPCVGGQLDPLGVDEHQPHLVRASPAQSTEVISVLMHVDLPAPVAPATRMCGIFAGWRTTKPPSMSLPRPTSIGWWSWVAAGAAQDVAEADDLAVGVGDLDADRALAGDRRR